MITIDNPYVITSGMQFDLVPFQFLSSFKLNYGDTITISMKDKSKETMIFAFKEEDNFSFNNLAFNTKQVEQIIFDYLVVHE